MTSNISDTELLELNIEPFDDDIQTQDEELPTIKDQDNQPSTNAIHHQQIITRPSHEIQHASERNDRRKEQQQTLKALNKKLDSLHTHLERAKQLYATNDRRPAYRPFMQRNLPFTSDSVYEITNSPASITFRISDRRHLRWNAQEQCLTIRAPQRCDTTSVWHNKHAQRIHTVTHSTDYAKYVYIYGLHIEAIHRAYFYFRPAPKYQNIFLEEKPFTYNGIKLRLTRAASKKSIIINKNDYIGNLQLITPLITRVIS